jgi:hypothetical protein
VADQCNFQILKHNSPVCIPRGRTALPFHTHSARHWRCGCAFTPTPPAPEGARLYPRFDPGGFNVFRHYGGLVWDQKNQLIVKMCPGKVCRVVGFRIKHTCEFVQISDHPYAGQSKIGRWFHGHHRPWLCGGRDGSRGSPRLRWKVITENIHFQVFFKIFSAREVPGARKMCWISQTEHYFSPERCIRSV